MRSIIIAASGFLVLSIPAFAQTRPSSNASVLGTETTEGNAAGAPSAATPAGQISTTGPGLASPMGVPALGGPAPAQATSPSADSSTTDTTTK